MICMSDTEHQQSVQVSMVLRVGRGSSFAGLVKSLVLVSGYVRGIHGTMYFFEQYCQL